MTGFLLFCIPAVLCWPLPLPALILFPIVWLLLPFRLLGVAVAGVLELIGALFLQPAKIVKAILSARGSEGDRKEDLVLIAA